MLTSLALTLATAFGALIIVAAFRPPQFRVERSTSIQAMPERIYPFIADFRRWPDWSPWEGKDPAMKRTLEGSAEGKGAVYSWAGNKQVGEGRMEILEAAPASAVTIKLDFMKPFEAHNTAEFTLVQLGTATLVTWAMHGPQPYLFRLMGMFFSMDRMVGKDFEQGLARLKAAAEAA